MIEAVLDGGGSLVPGLEEGELLDLFS